jgi:hypothetical protein
MVSALPFRLEEQMVEPLLSAIPALFPLDSGCRRCVLREPAISSVIPDVMIGTWRGDLPRFAGLNSVARHILAFLAREPYLQDEASLCDELFLTEPAARAAISRLVRIGAVAKRESGEIELDPQFYTKDTIQIVSIEMKLKRWREALDQAIQYKQFSDESWVVLDATQITVTADISDAFANAGIGLFLQCGWRLHVELAAVPFSSPPCADRVFSIGKLSLGTPYCLA